jgi:hypothetical protein
MLLNQVQTHSKQLSKYSEKNATGVPHVTWVFGALCKLPQSCYTWISQHLWVQLARVCWHSLSIKHSILTHGHYLSSIIWTSKLQVESLCQVEFCLFWVTHRYLTIFLYKQSRNKQHITWKYSNNQHSKVSAKILQIDWMAYICNYVSFKLALKTFCIIWFPKNSGWECQHCPATDPTHNKDIYQK